MKKNVEPKKTTSKAQRNPREDVRIITIRAASEDDLTPRQRTLADEKGLNREQRAKLAQSHQAKPKHGRRANETEDAYALRRRREKALSFVSFALLQLDESSCLADESVRDIIEAVEEASGSLSGGPAGTADCVGAIVHALEFATSSSVQATTTDARGNLVSIDDDYRTKAARDSMEAHQKRTLSDDEWDELAAGTRISAAKESAGRVVPALLHVPDREWFEALRDWPGYTPLGTGCPGAPSRMSWSAVVYRLMRKHGRTNASSPAELKKAWDNHVRAKRAKGNRGVEPSGYVRVYKPPSEPR